MLPDVLDVELCHAQNWVPKPLELCPEGVEITYCTLALLAALVLPKCAAARVASPARADWEMRFGSELPSHQTPASWLVWLPAAWPAPLQKKVPEATPWQYWVTLLAHELPPTWLKKLCWIPASPLGSLVGALLEQAHCEPHHTR